jgi:glycosyltransferase involved in cell wall biosynthesis
MGPLQTQLSGEANGDSGRRSAVTDVRVAFVTDIVTPCTTAALEALAPQAQLTAVFCSHTGSRGMAWRSDDKIRFRHEIIEGLTIPHPSRDGTDYYMSPRVLAAIWRARPQVVISGGFSIPTLYAAAYSRVMRIPLLIQSDGTSHSEARLRLEQRMTRRALRRLAWGAVASSAPAVRRFVEIGFPPGRVFRAPYTTRLEPLWRVAEGRAVRQDGPLRLLSVGRLIPRKGCEWLLRAVGQAQRGGTDVHLTMVGTGPEETRLRALADELEIAVSWRGFIDQPDLPFAYRDADAFVFPTLDDPFGMVLLEAAASGLPLIASPYAGATEELVRDGIEGFVVDPRDTAAMADSIARLGAFPELRAKLGHAAQATTRDHTPQATAADYLGAIEAAVAAFAR